MTTPDDNRSEAGDGAAPARGVPGWLKFGLELGPVLLFFLLYNRLRDGSYEILGQHWSGFVLTTAIFVPVMVASSLLLWRLTGRLSRMQVFTLVLVLLFGGLTVALNDERFLKMKPTILYLGFAAVLGGGLLRGRSWLGWLMGEVLPLTETGWRILTARMALFFLALAGLNEAVWRLLGTDAWVSFKTFGLPLLLIGFFMAQGGLIARHGEREGGEG